MEVVPIYSACLSIFNLFCGAIIMDEIRYYKWDEFMSLVFSSLICIFGITLLVRKPKLACFKRKLKRETLIQEHMEQIDFEEPVARKRSSINDGDEFFTGSNRDEQILMPSTSEDLSDIVPFGANLLEFVCYKQERDCFCLEEAKEIFSKRLLKKLIKKERENAKDLCQYQTIEIVQMLQFVTSYGIHNNVNNSNLSK